MIESFTFKLYPSKSQLKRLELALDACRSVYNWALEDRINMYRYAKVSTNFFDQSRYLKFLKEERPWLCEFHVHMYQTALKRVDLAFQAFFRRVKAKETPGFPRFKGKYYFNSFSFKELGNGFSFSGRRLKLSGIGRVRVVWHRKIEGKVKTCTIKREADGWYVTFVSDINFIPKPSTIDNPMSADLGLIAFATLSDGTKVGNPRLLRKEQKRIKRLQRKIARQEKNSKNRAKTVKVLKKVHQKLTRKRKDSQCNIAVDWVGTFNPIVVENLDVKGLLEKWDITNKFIKPEDIHRSIQDISWGSFLNVVLPHKAEKAGVRIIRVEPRGTSQVCSRCGKLVPKELWEREHKCPYCGLEVPRDLNSAWEILQRGLGKTFGDRARSTFAQMNQEAPPL